MKSAVISILATSAALIGATAVHAEPLDIVGPYAGVALGASSLRSDSNAVELSDDRGSTFRLYGGYQFTDHFGAELGYTRIGDATQTLTHDDVTSSRTLEAKSYYAAVTGRMALGNAFSLNGKLGLALGDVSSNNDSGDFAHATGRKRSLMAGIAAEYQPWQNVALTLGYDYYGKLSDELSAGTLTGGVRVSF